MNLFIGLLNIAIDKDNDRVSYLIQKAKILAEIELFYLLPNQRRWEAWFPEVIYYYANVDKTREEIKRLMNNGQWETNENELSDIKQALLKELKINDIDKNKAELQQVLEKKLEKTETNLQQVLDELKMMKQALLKEFNVLNNDETDEIQKA
ncbi:hypothetical protein C1645_878270 [Glomus cerebriforme]|uniref:Uncharacterized protein n=1 Tax=Glomus cerebriforme TaxID=658196 RepID=A0A397SLR3_9GLOM|nr:hypothetical protein C1645_878270 [Glomus cerebriforme]